MTERENPAEATPNRFGSETPLPQAVPNTNAEDATDVPKPGRVAPAPHITSYFTYGHLPAHLQPVSAAIFETAGLMQELLPEGAEKAAGFRKLLEAKDCFVRAALRLPRAEGPAS